ncbi:hypothetical protein KCU98_g4471, partial [Aureobasidium melanogenum]
MSSTANTHDESAATAASENNHVAGTDLLQDNNAINAQDNLLGSGADAEDHGSGTGASGDSTCDLEENKQAATNQLDRLEESWLLLMGEILMLEGELHRFLLLRLSYRCNNLNAAGVLSNVDICDASPEDLRKEQLMIAQDAQEITNLASLRERYKVIDHSTFSILDAAEECLIDIALVSETVVYEAAKRKVYSMELGSLRLKRRINSMLRTVFLPDSEAFRCLNVRAY